VLSIPANLITARRSARYGIVAIGQTTAWLAAGTIAQVVIPLRPDPDGSCRADRFFAPGADQAID
jgi:hypothetical protein